MIFHWLFIIILSYFFFSVAAFGDKLILSGFSGKRVKFEETDPALYTFFVGVLNILIVVFIPFFGLPLPTWGTHVWIILEALTMVLSLYFLYSAVQSFEVSKVVPVIGAFQPIFVFILSFLLFGTALLQPYALAIFVLLIAGSMFISFEEKFHATKKFLVLTVGAAALFSLEYVFSKLVFLNMDFVHGLIWMRIWSFVFAMLLLSIPKLRKRIFAKKPMASKKTSLGFVAFQTMGALAGLLQNWAVALVPVGYLAIMNSLRGLQYLFLFFIAVSFSHFLPAIFKERITQKAIINKSIGIFMIILGMIFL